MLNLWVSCQRLDIDKIHNKKNIIPYNSKLVIFILKISYTEYFRNCRYKK